MTIIGVEKKLQWGECPLHRIDVFAIILNVKIDAETKELISDQAINFIEKKAGWILFIIAN